MTTEHITPEQAVETLDKMIGQLDTMLMQVEAQPAKAAEEFTKARVLRDMREQLAALKMGKDSVQFLLDYGYNVCVLGDRNTLEDTWPFEFKE